MIALIFVIFLSFRMRVDNFCPIETPWTVPLVLWSDIAAFQLLWYDYPPYTWEENEEHYLVSVWLIWYEHWKIEHHFSERLRITEPFFRNDDANIVRPRLCFLRNEVYKKQSKHTDLCVTYFVIIIHFNLKSTFSIPLNKIFLFICWLVKTPFQIHVFCFLSLKIFIVDI